MNYTIVLNSGRQIYCYKYRTLEHGIGYQQDEGQSNECYISAQQVREIYPETQQERELWEKYGRWRSDMPDKLSRDGNCEYDRMMHKIREIYKSNISRSEMIMQLTAIRVKYECEQMEAMPEELKSVREECLKLKEENIKLQNHYLNNIEMPEQKERPHTIDYVLVVVLLGSIVLDLLRLLNK